MNQTFYFYDLETSGFNPREDRVMQFAGQRTDMNLQPISEPHDFLVKLSDDTVPSPDAILVTGITPQRTLSDGITEAAFLSLFDAEIAVPNTVFVGYNSLRFDDEFMRFLLYRNYYDPYEWQWKNGNSRWDLLDVVRMTRALRPDGITWPFDSSGKPSNRLELLTKVNNLTHTDAHDALSDVRATIQLAQLIQSNQPKLFNYLLNVRGKKEAAALVDSGKWFVYSSGKYAAEYEKTTVVMKLVDHPKKQGALVYDLRHDPTNFLRMTPEELVEAWQWKKDSKEQRLPVKTLQYNRCPAIAPVSVLDDDTKKRLSLDDAQLRKHRQLVDNREFINNILAAIEMMDKKQQISLLQDGRTAESQLYDGFTADTDKVLLQHVRRSKPDVLNIDILKGTKDERYIHMFPRYKARNFHNWLSDSEQLEWEEYRKQYLLGGSPSRLQSYFQRLAELDTINLSNHQKYILEELQLYGQNIMPDQDYGDE